MARGRGQTAEQILDALRETQGGSTVVDVCRQVGICEQTFYMSKLKYGVLCLWREEKDGPQASRVAGKVACSNSGPVS